MTEAQTDIATRDSSDNSEADSAEGATPSGRKKRTPRPFPAVSFKEALFLAEAIQKHGAGQRTRLLEDETPVVTGHGSQGLAIDQRPSGV